MSPNAVVPPGLPPAVRLAFWRQWIDSIEERISLLDSSVPERTSGKPNQSIGRVDLLREELGWVYEQIELSESKLCVPTTSST